MYNATRSSGSPATTFTVALLLLPADDRLHPRALTLTRHWASSIAFAVVTADVASVQPGFLGNATFNDYSSSLAISLAPQSVVAAMGVDPAAYCPLASLMWALRSITQQSITSLRISGFDLPLLTDPPSAGCAVPDCTAMGGCGLLGLQSVSLSTEPALLQRDVMSWLRDLGLDGGSVAFLPPPAGLWNPALNRSDWIPNDLFCDLTIMSLNLPALPWTADLRMPFPPPAGLLRCPSASSRLFSLDLTAVRFFSSDLLDGLTSTREINLQLDLDSLYGGVRPVPVGFFDPLPASVTVSGGCGSSCDRIASKCPYFIDGECRPCPPGSFTRALFSTYAYCSVCPVGSHCNSTVSLEPIPCPRGSYQPQSGQSGCLLCPVGQ